MIIDNDNFDEPRSVDLHEDGLLWLINRCVFHPRGFALGRTPGQDDFTLFGDGEEAWSYGPGIDDECFAAATACFRRVSEYAAVGG